MNTHSLTTRFLIVITSLFVIIIAVSGFWLYREVGDMTRSLGERYAVERVESTQARLARVLDREAALAVNLARSPVLIDWALNEDDPTYRKRALDELAAYRISFGSSNNFVGIAASRKYYNWSSTGVLTETVMDPADPAEEWFFSTIDGGERITFNLDYNPKVDVSRVWINCTVRGPENDVIALTGTGLEITDVISRLVSAEGVGAEAMLFDGNGRIIAHHDPEIMERNARATSDAERVSVFDLADTPEDREALGRLLDVTENGETGVARLGIGGTTSLTAVAPISPLGATVLVTVDISQFLGLRDFTPLFIVLFGTSVVALGAITFFMERLVLQPLATLTGSVERISRGDYAFSIPVQGKDEIATLSLAFNDMAARVKEYTENLEGLVAERTNQLTEVNNRLMESIRYASVIQKSIMPGEEALDVVLPRRSVLFRQRDVVGGDMLYVRASSTDRDAPFVLGVIDCEGHGVSGALMTMLVSSLLNQVIPRHDMNDPAAILTEVEEILGTAISTHSGFDIGLCSCFPMEKRMVYAGAAMPLYVNEANGTVSTLPGRRKAVRSAYRRKPAPFKNYRIESSGRTFCMVTDGFIDQSGGDQGRSYGTTRLINRLQRRNPVEVTWEVEFDTYRREESQRDDVLFVAWTLQKEEEILV